MRPFISLITLAACLLHFGLGCCAHHAHAFDGDDCGSHVHLASDCSHHDDDHEDQSQGLGSSETPDAPADNCNEGQCVFLVGAKTAPAKEVPQQQTWALVPELSAITDASVFASSPSHPEERPVLPKRLHLLHQIFLN